MINDRYGDLPLKELLEKAEPLVQAGALVFFKFTCERCGSRQTFDTPNILYLKGQCEECGHITELKKAGFSVLMRV